MTNTETVMERQSMHLPIGCSNFSDIINKKLDFVDKTLLIKELLESNIVVTVIVRPRRFGKTLNLSMLHYFLAAEVYGRQTQGLFDGLKIAELGDQYLCHQGKYPVIFVTFKDVIASSYPECYAELCYLISEVYNEHHYLLSSSKLTDSEKATILSVIERRADPVIISASLRSLSHYIYKHTSIKPWILIDEYDIPIQSGYLNGYYQSVMEMMRKLFGTALKDNNFLDRAVITGILRVSKESLFSGVNNINVFSLFDTEYSEYFGFTETEVEALLNKANLSEDYSKIRYWYNGYRIGHSTIYNPWSVINCIQKQGLLKPYWVNTSGNELVKRLLARGDEAVKRDLEAIIQGESITALINENMVFKDLETDRNAIWSLLFFCGYLKVIHSEYKEEHIQCELSVPNQEVMVLYRGTVRGWLTEPLGGQGYLDFLLSLTEGRVEEFSDRLQRYLEQMLSIFDTTGREPEKFYHGFVLGMMVSLSETHEVKSNHESGYGRYDVLLIPKDLEALGIILEFKTVHDQKRSLKRAAADALQQIRERGYKVELQHRGIEKILSMGLAFRGKQVVVLTN